MLAGLNDSNDQARTLARWMRSVVSKVKINLIPFNPHDEAEFTRPDNDRVEAFREVLERGGVEKVNVRRPRGDLILAACGQLALKERDE